VIFKDLLLEADFVTQNERASSLSGSRRLVPILAPCVLQSSHFGLPRAQDIDSVSPASARTQSSLPSFRRSIGNSNYFAGMVQLEKRFSHGFNINTTYTFSRFLNDNDGAGSTLGNDNGVYSNYYNRSADYGPSSNDIRHQFVFSSVYELPFGPRRAYLSNGVLAHAIGPSAT
jgi:hypothetical protein